MASTQEQMQNSWNSLSDIIGKLTNTKQSIIDKDGNPIRVGMLTKPDDQYTDEEKVYMPLNPEIQQDKFALNKIDEYVNKLKTQQQSLAKNFSELYGQALKVGDDNIKNIQQQTQNLLAGTAVEEARQRGYGAGQASQKGSTANLQAKVTEDARQAGVAERMKTMAAQQGLIQNAVGNQQAILQSAADALQKQDNFDRTLAAQQAAAKSSGGGGGSSGGYSKASEALAKAEFDAREAAAKAAQDVNAVTSTTSTTPASSSWLDYVPGLATAGAAAGAVYKGAPYLGKGIRATGSGIAKLRPLVKSAALFIKKL